MKRLTLLAMALLLVFTATSYGQHHKGPNKKPEGRHGPVIKSTNDDGSNSKKPKLPKINRSGEQLDQSRRLRKPTQHDADGSSSSRLKRTPRHPHK